MTIEEYRTKLFYWGQKVISTNVGSKRTIYEARRQWYREQGIQRKTARNALATPKGRLMIA